MSSYWETLRVPAGDLLDDMMTYVAQPDQPGKTPAVIVVQEIFGINSNIRSITDRFAEAGFFAVAPAIFHREGTSEGVRGTNPVYSYAGIAGVPEDPPAQEVRAAAIGNLRDENIILDINTTIEWLNKHPRVDSGKIGIVGFCAGGRITYMAAAACPGIGAAVDYYGGNCFKALGDGPTPFERTASIQCPIMGNFGDKDANPTVDDVAKLEAEVKKHGKTYDFKMYPGADHGFLCDERPSYHEPSAKDAWERTVGWFQKHLAAVGAKA